MDIAELSTSSDTMYSLLCCFYKAVYFYRTNKWCYIGFEVLAVTTKNRIFWVVMPCSLVQVHWPFGGIYCLLLQTRSVSQERNHQLLLVYCWFLARLIFQPWRWSDPFLWNVGDFYTTTGITTQKIVLLTINAFEMTAMKEVTGNNSRLKSQIKW
jgi:hypothetical protein